MLSRGILIYSIFLPLALAQQYPLLGVEYPESVISSVNFTKLFNTGDRKSSGIHTWAKAAYNGLTTYARTQPLRCFGEDAGVPYDVAILGACCVS